MPEQMLLSKVESALSSIWGGEVRLSFQDSFHDHPHVARLAVQKAPTSAPRSVILKRWRSDGEERFDPGSASHLFNDWASINFLASVLGDASPAPLLYTGDVKEGFFVLEDLGELTPLRQAFWGNDSAKAAEVMIHYGELLGSLHGKTAAHFAVYAQMLRQLDTDYPLSSENYLDFFQEPIAVLKRIGIEIPSSALEDIHEAAQTLTTPGSFRAFTHGDPVYSNTINWQGRWRLIDFEAGRFRHALLEGVYPRMIFPTTGLRDVMRIPDDVWRQSEMAYRTALSQHLPAASDDSSCGSALTAACAFWVLIFCERWLPLAIEGNAPPAELNVIRQVAITRFELFARTSKEFQSLTNLGTVFERLVAKLRAQWSEDACNLPLYPAFRF